QNLQTRYSQQQSAATQQAEDQLARIRGKVGDVFADQLWFDRHARVEYVGVIDPLGLFVDFAADLAQNRFDSQAGRADGVEAKLIENLAIFRIENTCDDLRHVENLIGNLRNHDVDVVVLGHC